MKNCRYRGKATSPTEGGECYAIPNTSMSFGPSKKTRMELDWVQESSNNKALVVAVEVAEVRAKVVTFVVVVV